MDIKNSNRPSPPAVPRVTDDWYVVCRSSQLKKGQLRKAQLFSQSLVLFRTSAGQVGALADRCPHRGVPLSSGKVVGDRLRCPYHGWEFATTGQCEHIPCYVGTAQGKGRQSESFATTEGSGYVWVYGRPGVTPDKQPFVYPKIDDPEYQTAHLTMDMEGSIHATAENALDVPHTAYLHGGLFRTPGGTREIRARIRRWHDRAEVEYIGEKPPSGLLGKLFAPQGGDIVHFDRFFLPSITQVEYRIGDRNHVLITAALTPISDHETRLFGMTAMKLGVPGAAWVASKTLRPLARVVLGQDARMLALQTKNLAQFGSDNMTSTDIDTLGPHILKLLGDAAARRVIAKDAPFEREIRMLV